MNKQVKVGFGVILFNDNRILLGKRKGSHGEGTWCLPGGHLEFNEKLKDAVKREVREETNFNIEVKDLISVSNDIMYEKHYITLGFKGEILKGELKLMEPHKCERWGWFSLDNLPKPLFIASERVINNYKDKIIFRE
jgi:8-oxo-dGTP diphosphatase